MSDAVRKVKENIRLVMVGMEEVTDLMLAAFFAGGHVLLEDIPGTGKTQLARSLSRSMDLAFGRIQFTPDLMPGDVTGINYYHQKSGEFVFRKGPVFSNILLADEINRATPRTQSALLECMAERQVTVDGETRPLEEPFFVIATENPVETYGCFPLPEAQLDRFLMKLSMGTLSPAQERALLDRFMENNPALSLSPVLTRPVILQMKEECRRVFVHEDLRDYIVAVVQATRGGSDEGASRTGVSPRGTLALLSAAKGYAYVAGRDFVTPEDIRSVAVPVLAHRMICAEEGSAARAGLIRSILSSVSVPTEKWSRI